MSIANRQAPGTRDKRQTLRVTFRVDLKEGGVTAVLPDVPAKPGFFTCYAHVGQHSECSRQWYSRRTRLATREEYLPLLTELEQVYAPDAVLRYVPIIR